MSHPPGNAAEVQPLQSVKSCHLQQRNEGLAGPERNLEAVQDEDEDSLVRNSHQFYVDLLGEVLEGSKSPTNYDEVFELLG